MKRFLTALLTLVCSIMLFACGGGGGSAGNSGATGAALYTTAGDKQQILPNETKTFKIGGGTPSYTATASSGAIVVSVSGTDLTVTGSSGGGSGSIVVKDKAGSTVTIEVTVGTGIDFFTNAPDKITLLPGYAVVYRMGGGTGAYLTPGSSNYSVADTGLNKANEFTIVGINPGTATVIAQDSGGKSKSVEVTVVSAAKALSTTSPASITIPFGKTVPTAANDFYVISGGTKPYLVNSDSVGVAIVSMNASNDGFKVTGIGAGDAKIYVTDAQGNSSVIAVKVTAPAASTLGILPAGATGAVGETLRFNIIGGTAPYSVSNSNDSIATVVQSLDGLSINAELKKIGSSIITVKDSVGATTTITVTATAQGSTLLLSPNAFQISEDSTDSYNLTIYGGMPPYTGFSNDSRSGSVSVSGNSLTVGAVGVGNRCVPNDYPVTLTVVDSKGAFATSVMTIKDNVAIGSCLSVAPKVFEVSEELIDPVTLIISGGTAPYTASTSDATKGKVSVSGSVLTIAGVAANGRCVPGDQNVTITVTDSKGAISTSVMTIKDSATIGSCLSATPKAFEMSEESTNARTLAISGGTPPYTATTSDATKGSVSVSGSVLTIAGVAANGRCVPADQIVTITVTDNIGATSPSFMTIKNVPGGICP